MTIQHGAPGMNENKIWRFPGWAWFNNQKLKEVFAFYLHISTSLAFS
jgi:hypothetical protein